MTTREAEEGGDESDFKFEEALNRLQEIVTELEDTDFNLDEALESYEKGVTIARECLKRLEEAELKIKELRLTDGTSS